MPDCSSTVAHAHQLLPAHGASGSRSAAQGSSSARNSGPITECQSAMAARNLESGSQCLQAEKKIPRPEIPLASHLASGAHTLLLDDDPASTTPEFRRQMCQS